MESLTALELKQQYPGLTIPDNYHGFYESDSGFLYRENCIRSYRERAVHYGAELSFSDPVEDIKSHTDFVEVRSKKVHLQLKN